MTTQPEQAGAQMRQTLDALGEFDAQIALIYPNADAGGKQMVEVIREYEEAGENRFGGGDFKIFENLSRRRYLGLLDAADAMVGNSSSGIIEAPSFGTPVVDVGPRQDGRERAENVESVPHETDAIREAIDAALHDEAVRRRAAECDSPYDEGGAATRIVDRLESLELDDRLLEKRLTY